MDTEIPQSSGPTKHVADEAVHKERGVSLVTATTISSSLEAEQDSGKIDKTQSKATLNEPSFLRTSSGSGPRCQETMGILLLKLAGVESSGGKESLGEDASKQGRIDAIDTDDDITLVSVAGDKVSNADVVTTVIVATTTTAKTIKEITLALADLKSTKPKAKGIAFRELGEYTTTTTLIPSKIQDKAEIDEEERITRSKEENIDETNIAWDDIQAKVDADYQLAERLLAEEQEQFIIEQKSTLFKELLE
ncbi:hypothetical protein Tco_1417582 [Tanacetum coccineum]